VTGTFQLLLFRTPFQVGKMAGKLFCIAFKKVTKAVTANEVTQQYKCYKTDMQ
jgi:hypothetical protein